MQGSCMSEHENKRYAVCRTKSMLNAYAWWCNDSCKMWCWNMITDKFRNDMFIMMPWRDAYAMHDMNTFYGHESPENYLFFLAHLGAQCPMCTVKKVIWTFRLPETNIQCLLEIKCGSDLIRTGVKTRDKLILFRKFITSQDLSDNTNFLAVSNYMGH